VSDHSCVFFNLNLPRDPPPLRIKAQRRVFKQDVAGKFSTLFDPCQLTGCSDVNVFVESFNSQCLTILDEVAPMKTLLFLHLFLQLWCSLCQIVMYSLTSLLRK